MTVTVDHLVLKASDRDATVAFYCGVLGADLVELPFGRIGLGFGDVRINVHLPDSTPYPTSLHPPPPGSGDVCFRWAGSIESAVDHLSHHGIAIIEGPVGRTGALGPATSVYCRDPDGNLVELLTYA